MAGPGQAGHSRRPAQPIKTPQQGRQVSATPAQPATLGKSAFDWNAYKSRKSALEHIRKNLTQIDTILTTEDGINFELVHSQIVSAFGEELTNYIRDNGRLIEFWPERKAINMVRLPKVDKYTLGVLVECAYTGYIRTDLASGGIWHVLQAADHYQMMEVIKACCAFLSKSLERWNCVHLFHVGIKHKNGLHRSAFHKIRANFKHILVQNQQFASIDRRAANSHETRPSSQSAATGELPPISPPHTRTCTRNAEFEQKRNNLATIGFEHFESLLSQDRLNIDEEEDIWLAIKLWCNYNLAERAHKVGPLLRCMRFPRLKRGLQFTAQQIWRDPLILSSQEAQHELAVLDRNHREYLTLVAGYLRPAPNRDGFGLPCAANPRQLRPRVPHSILLAIGGWQSGHPTTLIESYDMNCNMWFESPRVIMSPLAYHGIEFINGLLYICGGTDGGEILNELFTFNPANGDSRTKLPMRESRCYVSTAHLDGHLYAMGGHNGAQRMKTVERFDLVNETWAHIADMNVARSDASACVCEGKIYIAGGLNDQVIEQSVEYYNVKDNTWTFIQSMLTPRTSFTLLPLGCRLLAIGGNNGNERLSSVEQFDFESRVWSHHSDMRYRRSTFSAALLEDGKLMVVGGYDGNRPFNQVEMYDERRGQWTVMQKIRYDRSGLRVVVVSDLPNANEYTFLGSSPATAAASTGSTGSQLA